MPVTTGLSGNEMFCLHQKGLAPGNLVVGNSVYSLGVIGGIRAGFRTLAGGEVKDLTRLVHAGRENALRRLFQEAAQQGAIGLTGISSELVQLGGLVEFLSIGSCLHREGAAGPEEMAFSSCSDGQDLYCQVDAGYRPIRFVFGNVAYSVGIGRGIMGVFRSLARGEVTQLSNIFNETRHRALERITAEARTAGANAVVGIRTSIIPFQGTQEMVMVGTASHHPALPAACTQSPTSSDLTNQELWSLANQGYLPIQLVLGVSVYSLGFVGGMKSAFKGLVRGEIKELTTLIYEARENALARIRNDAQACGADDVVGIKTYVYQLGSGVIEFLAIGTAVKRIPGAAVLSPELPTQAVISDKSTFMNAAETLVSTDLNKGARSGSGKQGAPVKGATNITSPWDVVKLILKIILKFM